MNTRSEARPADPMLQRLLAHVDAHLDSPALTPPAAARALGISVRRLHSLLADGPHTFARLVARRRLQRAQGLLAERGTSVIDVAFACGFNSLATFYRQYAAAFGVSPAGHRRLAVAPLEVKCPQACPCAQ